MKKIITIIIIAMFLTGCYDNIELNDLAIISSVGIDHIEDNYYVTYEVLDSNSNTEDNSYNSYTVSGEGKNIVEAFFDTSNKLGKKSYFAHLKVVLISENVTKNYLQDITDYLLRDTNIRDEFKLVVTKDCTPQDILNSTDENNKVASNVIVDMLENDKYANNIAINETYEKIVSKLASNRDIILNSITIENEKIALSNSFIFNNYEFKDILSNKDSNLYNLLRSKSLSTTFMNEYNNEDLIINIVKAKAKYNIQKDIINIDLNLKGKVVLNNANIDLKEQKNYKKLNKDFEKIIKKEVKKFVKTLQKNNTDVLSFEDNYYKNTRKKNNDDWNKAEIKINVDLKINTKGFIFEVNNDK